MVEICFSESTSVSLEHVRSEGDFIRDSEIYCLPLSLSMGDISNLENLDSRKKLFSAINANSDPDYQLILDQYLSNFEENVKTFDAIRIWYSYTPDEFCGMLHVLYSLQQRNIPITAIQCRKTVQREDNCCVQYEYSSELPPDVIVRFFAYEMPVGEQQRQEYASQWEQLTKENSELRVVENCTVKSALMDYYDDIIRKHIFKEPFVMANLIGQVMSDEHLGIGDYLICSRLKGMLNIGELIMLQENKSFYLSTVKASIN